MASYLRIANLRKNYRLGDGSIQKVLNGITLDFNKGELVALLGESGSGKSTMLNIIGGLDKDFTGSVAFKGSYMSDYTEKEMDYYRKKSIGFIFQNYNLISHMTLLQNVEIAMTINGVGDKKRRNRAIDLLEMVGLKDERNKLPAQLSGGQKQRVAIARSLANNPSIILADEPTGALDKESAEIVFEILQEIAKLGKLVIIVTHSEQIANSCSRVVKIEEGLVSSDETNYLNEINDQEYEKFDNRSLKNDDIIKLSYGNIIRNKSRNMIISIGIAISIISMILILNLSQGLTKYVTGIYSNDLKTVQIDAYYSDLGAIDDSTLDKIKNINGVYSTTETKVFSGSYISDNRINQLTVFTEEDYAPTLSLGSYPSTFGEIIISENLALQLSNDSLSSFLGTQINLQRTSNGTTSINLKVVGIFESNENLSIAYVMEDDFIQIGYTVTEYNKLHIITDDLSKVSSVIDELEDMGFTTYQEDSDATTIIDYIYLGGNVLTGVSAASMVVGAIMIFIVFFICVVERTKEIGILKAIGCEKKDIRKMFCYEAAILGLGSGILGCIICLLLSILCNITTSLTLDTTFISYNPLYYILGVFVSVLVSIISGISPAINASELDPISALRYE